jgi:hypothetical protein
MTGTPTLSQKWNEPAWPSTTATIDVTIDAVVSDGVFVEDSSVGNGRHRPTASARPAI